MLEIIRRNNNIVQIRDTIDDIKTLVTPKYLSELQSAGLSIIDKSESVNRAFARAKLLSKKGIIVNDCALTDVGLGIEKGVVMSKYLGGDEVAIIPEGVRYITNGSLDNYNHIDRIYMPDSLQCCNKGLFQRLRDTKIICNSDKMKLLLENSFVSNNYPRNDIFDGKFSKQYLQRVFIISEEDVDKTIGYLFMLDNSLVETAKRLKEWVKNNSDSFRIDCDLMTYDIECNKFHIYLDKNKYLNIEITRGLQIYKRIEEVRGNEHEGLDTVILSADQEYFTTNIDYEEYHRYLQRYGEKPIDRKTPDREKDKLFVE